jgi:DNA-directed RNA polymerase subunit RPC12/RpoP
VIVVCPDCSRRFELRHWRKLRCDACAYARRQAQSVAWAKRTGYVAPSDRLSLHMPSKCGRCSKTLKSRVGQRSGLCQPCAASRAYAIAWRARRKSGTPHAYSFIIGWHSQVSLSDAPAARRLDVVDDWRAEETERGASALFWPSHVRSAA